MRCFWDPRQLRRTRRRIEIHNGRFTACRETRARDRRSSMLAAIGPTERPRDHRRGADPPRPPAAYVDFLKSAHADWRAAGREGDAFPYAFPVVRRRPLRSTGSTRGSAATLRRLHADRRGTWKRLLERADRALRARRGAGGERSAFALCRPPGHHAGADYMGGYCYLNSAAIAAEAAIAAGRAASRSSTSTIITATARRTSSGARRRLFASIHADPAPTTPSTGAMPTRPAKARAKARPSTCRCRAAPRSPPSSRALGQALERIAAFAPDLLICSYGADTYAGDPISHFAIETGRLSRRSPAASPSARPADPDRHGRRLCRRRAGPTSAASPP
jgi:acetoin utilization deacetylase AcuC-like enzyme